MAGNTVLVVSLVVTLFAAFAGLLVYATERAGGNGWDKSPE